MIQLYIFLHTYKKICFYLLMVSMEYQGNRCQVYVGSFDPNCHCNTMHTILPIRKVQHLYISFARDSSNVRHDKKTEVLLLSKCSTAIDRELLNSVRQNIRVRHVLPNLPYLYKTKNPPFCHLNAACLVSHQRKTF